MDEFGADVGQSWLDIRQIWLRIGQVWADVLRRSQPKSVVFGPNRHQLGRALGPSETSRKKNVERAKSPFLPQLFNLFAPLSCFRRILELARNSKCGKAGSFNCSFASLWSIAKIVQHARSSTGNSWRPGNPPRSSRGTFRAIVEEHRVLLERLFGVSALGARRLGPPAARATRGT